MGFIFYYVRTQKALDYLRNVYVHICTTHLFVLSCMYTRLYHAAKSLQSCPTVQPHRQQLTRPRHPWDSPGKNIEVGCHFLLQCMKAKSESEVAQSCLTLRDSMDCSLPGSSVHGTFQARVLEWGAIAFSRDIMAEV